MVLQLAMGQDEVDQDVVEVASVEAGRAQGMNLVRALPMVLWEVMERIIACIPPNPRRVEYIDSIQGPLYMGSHIHQHPPAV